MFRKNKLKAFTLVELVTVMIILSITFLFARPSFQKYFLQKEILKMKSDTELLESNINSYLLAADDNDSENERLKEIYISPIRKKITLDSQNDLLFSNKYFKNIEMIINNNPTLKEEGYLINLNNLLKYNNFRLNNDIEDYFIIINNDNNGIRVHHKTGFLLNNIYYNGLDEYSF